MLPPKNVKLNPILKRLGKVAAHLGLNAFLVGGAVRDLLSGKKDLDWDIMTEESPEPLVLAAAKLTGGRVTAYPQFGTFSVENARGLRIDFATARKETYSSPGALPEVVFSGLENDIFRRDFTVNALAVRLGGVKSGEIIDFFGGKRDLKNRILRVLHRKSFRDDPTRIFRLARFASRGFRIDRLTGKLALAGAGFISRISPERAARELLLILEEKDPYAALKTLQGWGITEKLLRGTDVSPRLSALAKIETLDGRLAFLFSLTAKSRRLETYKALRFSNKLVNSIEKLLAPAKIKPVLGGKDLIKMGYRQGPVFKTILDGLARSGIVSRAKARKFVFDNFPQKI